MRNLILHVTFLRVFVCCCLITCTKVIASGQVPLSAALRADTHLSADQLAGDVRLLRQAYEALHPGLYRYNTPEQIGRAFAELSERLKKGATLRETFLALSEFTAKIKCGHTYVNFFNQRDNVVSALFTGKNRVPFYFRWIDDRMVVTRDLSAERSLSPGTEVLSINSVKTADMLRRLLPMTRADGANDAKRIALLGVTGVSR